MAQQSNHTTGYGHDTGGARPFPRPHQPASDFRRSGTFPPLSALISGPSGGSAASASGSASGSSSSLTGSSSGGHGHWGPAHPPPPWTPQSSYAERPQLPPSTSGASPSVGMTLPQPSGSAGWAYASSPPPPHQPLPSPTVGRSPAGFHPHLARGEGRSPTGAWLSYNDPGQPSNPPKTVPSPQSSSWREAPYPYYPHPPPFNPAHSTVPYAHGPTSQPLPPPPPSQSPQTRHPSSGYGTPLPPTGATHAFPYHPPPPPVSPHYHAAPHLSPYAPAYPPAYPPHGAPHGSPPTHSAGYSGMPAPPTPHAHSHAGPQSPPIDRRPPPSTSPSTSTPALQDSDRPRQARNLACEFCRQRKLRCIVDDGNKSCRQCVRRNKDCSLPTAAVDEAPSVPKATKKRRAADDPATGKASSPTAQKKSRKKQPSPSRASGSGSGSGSQSFDAGQPIIAPSHQGPSISNNSLSMVLHPHQEPTQEDAHQLLALNASSFDGSGSLSNDSFQTAFGDDTQDDSIETIDRSDLLTTAIPQPRTVMWGWDPNWWDRCLSFFGERSQSIRIVENLLSRFVTRHASLTGIFHASTFVDLVRRPEKRQSAQPALIFAALAAAVCDLNLDKQEPYTADVAAADANGKRLIQQLRASADEYIEATVATPNAQTIPLAQAATVLALTEKSTGGRRRLFNVADYVIRSLGVLNSNIIVPADETLLCTDRSVIRYDRPRLFGPSEEGEIAAEMASRLAKAPMGLVFREALLRPDEDDPNLVFPDYSPFVRPFDFWAPSQLPDDLPEAYHLSTHISRAGATVTRAYGVVSRIPPHGGASNEDIYRVLKDLEEFENIVPWMRTVNQADVTAIFPQNAQILIIKAAVFTRMSLWRKTKAWTLNGALLRAGAEAGNSSSNSDPPMLASFHWWFDLLRDRIQSLEADSTRHLATGDKLNATDGEIDSALRHICLAMQMLTVLPRPPVGIRQLLNDALSTLQIHVNLRAANPASSSLGQRIEQVREDVRRFGTPSPQGTSPETRSNEFGARVGGSGGGVGGGSGSSLDEVAAADSATLSSILQGHVAVPASAAPTGDGQQQQQSQLGVQLLPTTTAAM